MSTIEYLGTLLLLPCSEGWESSLNSVPIVAAFQQILKDSAYPPRLFRR